MTRLVSALVVALGTGCALEPTAPAGAPYMAVLVSVDAPPEVTQRGPYLFHVRELSGTLHYDTVVSATPKDTVILSVPAATYVVQISDVPATCGVRYGAAQLVVIPANTNTTVARFDLVCRNAVTLMTLTDGNKIDSTFTYTLSNAAGNAVRAGLIGANDTVLLDGLLPGQYALGLRQVDGDCSVVSDGGDVRNFELTDKGGATISMRVICSDPVHRPRLTRVRGSVSGDAVAYSLRIFDPDGDLVGYSWDLTDCQRHSLLPGGWRLRGGLRDYTNSRAFDSAAVIGAQTLPAALSTGSPVCQAVYVSDERGNISEIVESPVRAPSAAHAPRARSFNALLVGTIGLRVVLAADDPDGDLDGVFVFYTTRDGIVILPPDGQPDRIIFQPAGILGTQIADIRFDIGYGAWSDYYGVTAFLVDREGNFVRLDDNDLFH